MTSIELVVGIFGIVVGALVTVLVARWQAYPLSMKRSTLLRYCVAVLAVGLALLSQLLHSPFILQQTPFLLVSAAVVVAAWYGGLGPGLLATFLAAPLTDYYLLPPIHSLSSPGLQGLPVGVFVIEGVVVSSLIAALRSARQRAEASTLEAHRHQQNLRRSEERFRLLVEGVIDYAIFMLDPTGRVATWNESAERIQGYKAEEILGEHFSRFYTQEDVSRGHPEEQLRVATTAGRYEGEGWQVSKNGSHFWASILITALKDEAGNLRGFARVTRDITERKRAEEAVSQSEALYRTVVEQAAENIFLVDAETKRIVRANAAMQRSLGCTSEEIRAMTLYDVVAHDHESIDRKIRLIRQEGSFSGERKYRRKDGSLVDVDVSASLISLGGRETFCIVAHDVTERRLMEQRLRNTVNRLLALYDAGRILGSSLQQETIGATLVEIVRRVADSSAALIYVQDSSERLRVLYASDPKGLAGHLRETPAAEAAHRAALDAGDRRLFDSWDLGGSPVVGLIVPLQVRARSIGALEVYGSKGLAENETVETLASLANQAASALENARLFEQLTEHQRQLRNLVQQMLVVQEEERRRVAYEVHDGLTQMAVAAYQRLQAFAEDHPPDSAKDREELDETMELVQQTVGEARRVIAGLRPTALDDLGLVAAIRQQVETMRSEGWQIEYEQNLGNVRLSPTAETALFRVTQEALTNVRRHAHTTRAHVSLERQDKTVRLRVRDQGQGFQLAELESESGPGERVGLSSMRERVALLGGNFEVRSQSGTGTSITVEIPLTERGELRK